MKLTIKHLAGYLPYGLKAFVCGNELEMTIEDEMDSQTISLRDVIENKHKIILRPLLDLTKEIEVNGEKFVPIIELKSQCGIIIERELDNLIKYKNYGDQPFWAIQKLYEWHFDLFGLIENNLAIDKNTLL